MLTADYLDWSPAPPPIYSPPTISSRDVPLIGFTGLRNVGKSTAASLLEEEYGFEKVHAVELQKESWKRFFAMVTGSAPLAMQMVYGDLKDVPSEHLPDNSTPRFYMEKAGKFHADLGPEWTLGLALKVARRNHPRAPIVVESVVYEAPWFRQQGGVLIRLVRPGFDTLEGVETDRAQAGIVADHTIYADNLADLYSSVRQLMQQIVGGR